MDEAQKRLAGSLREDSIKAIEPNKAGLALSKALKVAKDALNYPGKLPERVPLVGGMGAGDLVMGHGPELAEDWAHGFGPFGKGKGLTTVMDPRLADLALTPTFGAVGGAKMAGKSMARALGKGVDLGRREALKKGGALAGSAAMGGGILGKVAEHITPTEVVAGAAKEVAPAVAGQWSKAAIAKLADDIVNRSERALKEIVDDFMPEELNERLPEEVLNRMVAGEVDDVDQAIIDRVRSEMYVDYENNMADHARNLIEDSIKKYGEVDEGYIQDAISSEYLSKGYDGTIKNSPHIKLYPGGSVEGRDLVREWSKKYTKEEFEKMLATGRFPEDFPKGNIGYGDIRQALYYHGIENVR